MVSLVFAVGVLANVALDYLMVVWGQGTLGIAVVTIVSQGAFTILFYCLAWGYMVEPGGGRTKEIWLLLLPLVVTAGFSIGHLFLALSRVPLIPFSAISLVMQLGTWTFVLYFFYGGYVGKEVLERGKGIAN